MEVLVGVILRALYWFRRDLRLFDNRALAEAYSRADRIVAIYILDTDALRQRSIDLSHPTFNLVFDALRDISDKARAHVLMGRTRDVIEELLGEYAFDAVYTATPLSWSEKEQAQQVREVCLKHGVRYVEILDNVLSNPFQLNPSPNFAAFYRRWLGSIDASLAPEVSPGKFERIDLPDVEEFIRRNRVEVRGSETLRVSWGEFRLRSFDFAKYDSLKDFPGEDGTSRLSPFISQGVISVREAYRAAENCSREFIRQLAWREYYYSLWVRYPWMNELELKPYMRGIEWSYDKDLVESFMEGKTGYPIVDAGIRQLKMEGWVHNRVRLIVASFLVKDLLVDWRVGEEFFRRHLADYDEVLNVGNWQWAASVGVDPLPLRVFNPIRQSEKYDPLCRYIKKYVPELEGYDCRSLHNPLWRRIEGYYEPIVDHYEQIRKFRKIVREQLRRMRGSMQGRTSP